jgi:hypothetical protein
MTGRKISDERITALAQAALRTLRQAGVAVVNERLALAEAKRVLASELRPEDRIDEAVRRKIASLSRRVVPGSAEWDVLYRKYAEEELRKTRARNP